MIFIMCFTKLGVLVFVVRIILTPIIQSGLARETERDRHTDEETPAAV